MAFTADQLDRMRRLAGVRPDTDVDTTVAALCEALDEMREHVGEAEFNRRTRRGVERAAAQRAQPPGAAGAVPPAAGSGDVVVWAVATGRISEAGAEFWQAQVDDERRRTGSAAHVEATLRGLHPVLEVEDSTSPWTTDPVTGRRVLASGRRSAASTSDTPLLDALERDIYGPTAKERERAEDQAAEAALAEQIEAEERARAEDRPLTEAEERDVFGPGR